MVRTTERLEVQTLIISVVADDQQLLLRSGAPELLELPLEAHGHVPHPGQTTGQC